MRRITLLTDFGTRDGYVAAMKGVLASLAPGVALDDVSHALPQGDVRTASWTLGRYWRRFPPATVHLVVVDPGVGTGRRALAVEADGRFVVVPDNGVVSRVLSEAREWRAVEIGNPEYLPETRSSTFHGRDVFAPAAGHLAAGVSLEELGPAVSDPVRLRDPEPRRRQDGAVEGEVISVDRFGNLVTNIPGKDVEGDALVSVGEERLVLRTTYGEVEPGEPLALINSDGRLEVAVRDGSAAERWGLGRGAPVRTAPR